MSEYSKHTKPASDRQVEEVGAGAEKAYETVEMALVAEYLASLPRAFKERKRKKAMFRRRLIMVGTTLIVALIAAQMSFAQGRWVYLGEANVDGSGDHDTIRVGRDKGAFRALQIHVEKAAINFEYLVAKFENGGTDRLEIRGTVPAGGTSRIIDLKGNARELDSVEVWYARGNYRNSQKPRMRLFGRH